MIVYPDLACLRARLGNQLWRIAGTLGIAASLGDDARFGPWAYRMSFSIPERYFDWSARWDERDERDAAAIPAHIAPRHRPWLQDAWLWLHIEHRIRRYFAPSPLALDYLYQHHAALLELPNKIAVHVRRGDYLTSSGFHPTCSQRYYRTALELLPEGNIIVFSDDPDWCMDALAWMRPRSIVGHQTDRHRQTQPHDNPDCLDLFLMSLCDRHVIANSSFSWWGAFLSKNPRPIYPLRWYGPAFSNVDASLMFLPDWIGLGD